MRGPRIAVALAVALALQTGLPAAWAQPAGKVPRIIIVFGSTPVADLTEGRDPSLGALFPELRRLGYEEGKSLVVERRSAEGHPERQAELAREVVSLKPDLIFAGSGRMTRALKAATTTIPIVGLASDPVGTGLVASLARPGGNITGFSIDPGDEIQGKRLELLKDAFPSASRVVVLVPRKPWEGAYGGLVRDAARRMGMALVGAPLQDPIQEPEYRRVFAALGRQRPDALFVGDHAENWTYRGLVVELAAQRRLPAIYPFREFAEAGGLMSYGVDTSDLYRRAAGYIDRILKGARPGDLPFQQPTKFELVVNVKTARALGLTIAQSVMSRADDVIQ